VAENVDPAAAQAVDVHRLATSITFSTSAAVAARGQAFRLVARWRVAHSQAALLQHSCTTTHGRSLVAVAKAAAGVLALAT
jgi:hypothetical protein